MSSQHLHADPGPDPDAWDGRDRLLGMLHAQQRCRDALNAELRGSPAWFAANEGLDRMNDRLLHLATAGQLEVEPLGPGVAVDVDSVPEDDEAFRDAVIDSLRAAMADRARRRLEERTEERIGASESAIAAALDAIARAHARLQRRYPDASLDARVASSSVIDVLAQRQRDVA